MSKKSKDSAQPQSNVITNKAISKTVKVGGYSAVTLSAATGLAIQSAFIGAGALLAMSATAPALVALGAGAAAFSAIRAGVTSYKTIKAYKDVKNLADGKLDKVADRKPAKFRSARTAFNLAVNGAVAGAGVALLMMMPAASLPITICAWAAAGLGGAAAVTNTLSLTVTAVKKMGKKPEGEADNDNQKMSKRQQKQVKKAVEVALTDKSVQKAFVDSMDKKVANTNKPAKKRIFGFKR